MGTLKDVTNTIYTLPNSAFHYNLNLDTDLTGANLSGANLSGANLSGANLTNTIISNNTIPLLNLTNTILNGVIFGLVDEESPMISYDIKALLQSNESTEYINSRPSFLKINASSMELVRVYKSGSQIIQEYGITQYVLLDEDESFEIVNNDGGANTVVVRTENGLRVDDSNVYINEYGTYIINGVKWYIGSTYTYNEYVTPIINMFSPRVDDLTWKQLGSSINGENNGDRNGYSVSVNAYGNIVAIGATYNEDNGMASGHVRVFAYMNDEWQQLGENIVGEERFDLSGYSVSLNAEGNILAIGAHQNDGGGDRSGHVRVYSYDISKTEAQLNQEEDNFGPVGWNRLGGDIDGESESEYSGESVSLSADGRIIAIGAIGANGSAGNVRVYIYDSSKTDADENGPIGWNKMGSNIVGEKTNDKSGNSVSLSADGYTVAIGAPYNDQNGTSSGHVRVYGYNGSDWDKLGNDIVGEKSYDYSGTSVSLSADGRTVAIGAKTNDGYNGNVSDSGHVRVYSYDTEDGWLQMGGDIDYQYYGAWSGYSVSLSADGQTVAIGAPFTSVNAVNDGNVRIYRYISCKIGSDVNGPIGWYKIGVDITGVTDEELSGHSVSLSADGYTVVIGAYANNNYKGIVRIYQLQQRSIIEYNNELLLKSASTIHPNANLEYRVVDTTYGDINGSTYKPIVDYTGTHIVEYYVFDTINNVESNHVIMELTVNEEDNDALGELLIDGIVEEGSTISANTSNIHDIDGDIVFINYAWEQSDNGEDNWTSIVCETKDYEISSTQEMVGKYIRVKVTSKDQYSNTTDFISNAYRVSNVNDNVTGELLINGDIKEGALVTADTSQLSDDDGELVFGEYIWEYSHNGNDDWITIIGESNAIYQIPNDNTMAGKYIRVKVTSKDPYENITEHSSNARLVVNVISLPEFDMYSNTTNDLFWQQLGNDILGEGVNEYIGVLLSLSSDGTTVALGSPYNDVNGNNSGVVRIYRYNGSEWDKLGGDIYGENSHDRSGTSVSLSSNGRTVAIGGSNYNNFKGHVRIFTYDSDGGWLPLGEKISGVDTETEYSHTLSLSENGRILAVGSPVKNNYRGRVTIYQFNGSSWEKIGGDIDGEKSYDFSGGSVSLSADGRTVAIGASGSDEDATNSGHVRIYSYNGSEWYKLGSNIVGEKSYDFSGGSVSLSADGRTVAIGASGNDGNDSYLNDSRRGHVRIYIYNDEEWVKLGNDIDGKNREDRSGTSVSLSADGRTVAIGASGNDGNGSNSGHVRVFAYYGVNWIQIGDDIDGKNIGGRSGTSVSLSADGRRVAIGAPYVNNFKGQVSIYDMYQNAIVDEDTQENEIILKSCSSIEDNVDLEYRITIINEIHGVISLHEIDGNHKLLYTPNENYNGTVNIEYYVYDALNFVNSKNISLSIQVSPVNDSPKSIGKIDDITLNEDFGTYTIHDISSYFNDIDDTDLTYTVAVTGNINIINIPNVLEHGSNSITLTSVENAHGLATITITATDHLGLFATQIFNVIVSPVNDSPILNELDRSIILNKNFGTHRIEDISIYFNDNDGDILNFSVVENYDSEIVNVSIEDTTLIITSVVNSFGKSVFNVKASESEGEESIIAPFNIEVLNTGCIDETYIEYDENATIDNGSCKTKSRSTLRINGELDCYAIYSGETVVITQNSDCGIYIEFNEGQEKTLVFGDTSVKITMIGEDYYNSDGLMSYTDGYYNIFGYKWYKGSLWTDLEAVSIDTTNVVFAQLENKFDEVKINDTNRFVLDTKELTVDEFKKTFYGNGEHFMLEESSSTILPDLLPENYSINNEPFKLENVVIGSWEDDIGIPSECWSVCSLLQITNELLEARYWARYRCNLGCSLTYSELVRILNEQNSRTATDIVINDKLAMSVVITNDNEMTTPVELLIPIDIV